MTVEDTARALLRYFRLNPGAEDTLEGIVRWWLLNYEINQQVVLVESALSILVEDKKIERLDKAGQPTRFRVLDRQQSTV